MKKVFNYFFSKEDVDHINDLKNKKEKSDK